MKLLSTSSELRRAFGHELNSCRHVSFAVAWASNAFAEMEALNEQRTKIVRGIVGTHFFQTHPDFIKAFMDFPRLRFMGRAGAVYHPKLYLFEKSRGWSCIVGSANFTKSAFSANREIALLFESTDKPHGLRTKIEKVIEQDWRRGERMKPFELARYTDKWRTRRKKARANDDFFEVVDEDDPIADLSIVRKSWTEYVREIERSRYHSLAERIDLLRAAKERFERPGGFLGMSDVERGEIAGFRSSSDDMDWGAFGSMFGAGRFKKLVNNRPDKISAALDRIPIKRTVSVSKEQFLAFARAFDGYGYGLATGTRLLAMKRPDQFVCVDKANKKKLFASFNTNLKTHDFEKYWNTVIVPIRQSDWWRSRPPKAKAKKAIWDGRAAFLDALFYRPLQRKT